MRIAGGVPGECPICGATHATCRTAGPPEPVTMTMTPARDAMAEAEPNAVPLGDGTDTRPFSTGTYRDKRRRVGA